MDRSMAVPHSGQRALSIAARLYPQTGQKSSAVKLAANSISGMWLPRQTIITGR
jgi:hypothetical protein